MAAMVERHVFKRIDFAPDIEGFSQHIMKSPYIQDATELAYTLMAMNSDVASVEIEIEQGIWSIVAYSDSQFDSYTLGFLMQHKRPDISYNITVKKKVLVFIKDIQSVHI